MSNQDPRPAVWVGHIGLYSNEVAATTKFMQSIGMRLIMQEADFALLELRGGTHLVVTSDPASDLPRRFDLMVDDLDAMHRRLNDLGLKPGAIERGEIHDSFEVVEPGGQSILFNSSHVGELPV